MLSFFLQLECNIGQSQVANRAEERVSEDDKEGLRDDLTRRIQVLRCMQHTQQNRS